MTDSAEREALERLRDLAIALLAADREGAGASETLRERTYAAYLAYRRVFGPLNRSEVRERRGGRPDPQTGLPELTLHRPDLGGFRDDPHLFTVMALETYDADTGVAEPAPVLTRRVRGTPVTGGPATVHEALVALGPDPARIADALGRPEAAVLSELGDAIFRDPAAGGAWVNSHDYLSGDLRAKREVARAAAADDEGYRRNVEALERATPADLGPLEITVSLGAAWISARDVEAFVHEVLGGRVTVWHLPSEAMWKVVPTGRIPVTRYRTARMGPYELLSAGLNRRSPIVFDVVAVPGRRLRVRNSEDSLAAQDMLEALQQRFRDWVWTDEQRTLRLCREYNRMLNSHALRRRDGSRLTFPGLADGVQLWPWQRDIVAQIVSSPATLCAHAVGAGKTRAMVCAALTARRLQVASTPMIAVAHPPARADRTRGPTGLPRGAFPRR